MDHKFTSIDFAAIGHQDSWEKIYDFVHSFRKKSLVPLSMEEIKETYGWIPSCKLFNIEIYSTKENAKANGIYIETFISPDELAVQHYKSCLKKIKDASEIAARYNVGIAALGGFTSIVLEGGMNLLNQTVKHTTGNSLTAAIIIKSVEKACDLRNLSLGDSTLLIIGSTGDIGIAISDYFSNKTKAIWLCARNEFKLKKQLFEMKLKNANAFLVNDVNNAAIDADIIISVASSSNILTQIRALKPQIICDAGYPKNLGIHNWHRKSLYYHGGMGKVNGGMKFSNDIANSFYIFPVPDVIHGCLLEAIVLSFEKKYESYSSGKGNITIEKMEEIFNLAKQHGVTISPYYNHKGICH